MSDNGRANIDSKISCRRSGCFKKKCPIQVGPRQEGQAPGLPDGLFFKTKNPNLAKFLRALERKKLVYSVAILE
jgi:hypothetical protein